MRVLIKMEMPKNCRECNFCNEINFEGYLWFDFYCRAKDKSFDLDKNKDKPDWCPLIEVHEEYGDLIDKEKLYERTAEWESQAINQVQKLMHRDDAEGKAEWRRWSAILNERTAFKYDVADAPVVIEGNL